RRSAQTRHGAARFCGWTRFPSRRAPSWFLRGSCSWLAKTISILVRAQEDFSIRHGRTGVGNAAVVGDHIRRKEFKLRLRGESVRSRLTSHAVKPVAREQGCGIEHIARPAN